MLKTMKGLAQSLLRRAGYALVRVDTRYAGPSAEETRPLPDGALDALRPDHPRLADLRRRYAAVRSPMATPTMWAAAYRDSEIRLERFRGDNAYLWQFRNVGASARDKYYFYLRDLAQRDRHGLLRTLSEDGLFGCWTFHYPGWPDVSRDLLDSINELYFLDRHLQLLSSRGRTVLDIGAGYGRLAHRALAAAPGLSGYLCVDAIPESTFLCEYYLRFRNAGPRAEVVAFDELERQLAGRAIDLAVNVHSFSEMSEAAIDGWLSLLARLKVPHLFVVPNDAERLLTMEADGTRRDFRPLLARHGFTLVAEEPVFPDDTLRAFMGVQDRFFLFHRA